MVQTSPSATVTALFPGARVKALRDGRYGLLWDPVAEMPTEARHRLRQRLVPVATAAFDGTSSEFWAGQWTDDNLDRLDVLHLAVEPDGEPVGWVAGTRTGWAGRRTFYASTAGVSPEIQGGGVSAALWRRVVVREVLRALPRPLFVVLRTGNPLVYDAWTTAAGDERQVHPRPHVEVPLVQQQLGRAAAAYLGQEPDLDPAVLLIRDAYRSTPAGLWRDRPRSRREETNTWFDRTLQITDAYLVIARFRLLPLVVRSLVPRRRSVAGAADVRRL